MFHFVRGTDSVPGEGEAGATVDSRERFYGATFSGYGLACIRAPGQSPIPAGIVRGLVGVFLAGGIGRLVPLPLARRRSMGSLRP